MLKKMVLSGVTFLLTVQSWGAGSCLEFFAKREAFHVVTTSNEAPKGAPNYYEYFMGQMGEINKTLGDLSVSNLWVVVSPLGSVLGSYFMPGRDYVFVGGLQLLRSKADVNAVFAHETGHASFDQHMKVELDGVVDSMKNHREAMENDPVEGANNKAFMAEVEQINNLERQITSLRTQAQFHESSKLNEQLKAAVEQLLQRYNSEKFKMVRLYDRDRMLITYNELYADLVAYFKTGNPSAIAEAIGYEKPEDYNFVHIVNATKDEFGRKVIKDFGKPRDFTTRIKIEGWKHEHGPRNYYTMFEPVRGELYARVLKNLKPDQQVTFLKAYLAATAEHMDIRVKRGETSGHFALGESKESGRNIAPADQLNAEFLELVLKHAGQSGLEIGN